MSVWGTAYLYANNRNNTKKLKQQEHGSGQIP